jgi:peroxidase
MDEPILNWTLPEPSENDMKEAIDSGKEALGSKEILEEIIVAPVLNSPTYRHQRAVGATSTARLAGKRGYVEDHATQYLAKKYNFKKMNGRRNVGKGSATNLDKQKDLHCSSNARYRSYDGTCNNHLHKYWGSAYIPFRRGLNPDYCDGISSPRCDSDGMDTLPSARDISVTVHRPSYFNDQHFTVMLAVWGQFLDHDVNLHSYYSIIILSIFFINR